MAEEVCTGVRGTQGSGLSLARILEPSSTAQKGQAFSQPAILVCTMPPSRDSPSEWPRSRVLLEGSEREGNGASQAPGGERSGPGVSRAATKTQTGLFSGRCRRSLASESRNGGPAVTAEQKEGQGSWARA